MPLKLERTIEIPGAAGSSFDHGAFDPKSRRVFIAHTGGGCVEVIDHGEGRHVATLPGFQEAAGVVAAEGMVLVTNRGAASVALPGRPRWCVTDAAGERVFLAIRDPSTVLVADLPELKKIEHWKLPSGGAHGMDIDHVPRRAW
jgi:hypothetical protein